MSDVGCVNWRWRDGASVSFRARALERDAVILNNGLAILNDG
jgi:hypothetical protein